MTFQKGVLTATGKMVLGVLLLLIVLFMVWWVFFWPRIQEERALIKEFEAAIRDGRSATAEDAISIHDKATKEEQHYDQRTSEGNQGIRDASGADTTIHPDAACAGLRALCMQRSYKDSKQCAELPKSCPK